MEDNVMLKIDISNMNSETSVAQAKQKGQQFARDFKHAIHSFYVRFTAPYDPGGMSDPKSTQTRMIGSAMTPANETKAQFKADSVVAHLAVEAIEVVQRLTRPEVRDAFLYELAHNFGHIQFDYPRTKTRNKHEISVQHTVITQASSEDIYEIPMVDSHHALARVKWGRSQQMPLLDKSSPTQMMPTNGALVVPVSKAFTMSGETFTFNFQATKASTTGTSHQYAMTFDGSVQAGLDLKGISAATGVNVTWTDIHQHSRTKTTSQGFQVSKSYRVQKVGRFCLLFPDATGAHLTTQIGRKIIRLEGGDPVGPIWQAMNESYNSRSLAFPHSTSDFQPAEVVDAETWIHLNKILLYAAQEVRKEARSMPSLR